MDKAFSEIFVKIKELKAQRLRHSNNLSNNPKKYAPSMSKEEEEAVRKDSMRKRIQKFYENAKKKLCVIS